MGFGDDTPDEKSASESCQPTSNAAGPPAQAEDSTKANSISSSGPNTAAGPLSVVVHLAQYLWREEIDFDDPYWPPEWLKTVAYVLIAALCIFVAFGLSIPIVHLLTAVANWLVWLYKTDLAGVTLDPIRKYLNSHTQGMRLTPSDLWRIWSLAGMALFLLSIRGSIGARIGWAIFGVGACAMAWGATPQPSPWLAAGITALWWSALSVAAYRRLPPRFAGRRRHNSSKESHESRRVDPSIIAHMTAQRRGFANLAAYFNERGNQSIPVIAKELSVPKRYVQEMRSQFLDDDVSTRGQLSPQQQKDILAEYRSGNQSATEIAHRCGVSVESVRRVIKRSRQRQP